MTHPANPRRRSATLPIRVIACPHCEKLSRYFRSRWGLQNWDLFTDLARISRSHVEPHPIAKCSHCSRCFWRYEAGTVGYLSPERLHEIPELFGIDRIPETAIPFASDLEQAISDSLPRFRSDIWRIHLMAWRRLNDGLRFEPAESRTTNSLDRPIRMYIADALLKKMPNRHALMRLLRIDILRQIARFPAARQSARKLRDGLGIVKSLGEQESLIRNALYGRMIDRQLELIDRADRLPRRYALLHVDVLSYHRYEQEMHTLAGGDERLRPALRSSTDFWQRVVLSGWTCHNCGRGGRAGTDFSFDGSVICRHCGWPQ